VRGRTGSGQPRIGSNLVKVNGRAPPSGVWAGGRAGRVNALVTGPYREQVKVLPKGDGCGVSDRGGRVLPDE